MAKLPKYPKGLKASITKLEAKAKKAKAIADRKKEIARMKAKRDALRKKL